MFLILLLLVILYDMHAFVHRSMSQVQMMRQNALRSIARPTTRLASQTNDPLTKRYLYDEKIYNKLRFPLVIADLSQLISVPKAQVNSIWQETRNFLVDFYRDTASLGSNRILMTSIGLIGVMISWLYMNVKRRLMSDYLFIEQYRLSPKKDFRVTSGYVNADDGYYDYPKRTRESPPPLKASVPRTIIPLFQNGTDTSDNNHKDDNN